MPKKILYIINRLTNCAPITVTYNIIKNLDFQRYTPIILTLSKELDDTLINKFKDLGIEIICIDDNDSLPWFCKIHRLKQTITNIEPDMIHAQLFRSTIFTFLCFINIPKLTTIHCDYDEDFTRLYGKFKGWVMSRLMDVALTVYPYKYACSEYLANILNKKKYFKVNYVNNGIDINRFKPIVNKNILRDKLNLPKNKTIFIWSAVHIALKNPFALTTIIKKCQHKNLFFVICGDGPLKEKMQREVFNCPNVLFTGNVNNIEEYLQASDFYISTSFSEGLPLSVLEAMACGLPIILSDIPQHKIVMKKDVGYTYNIDNIKDLMNKINIILERNYKQLSLNSIEVIQNNFTAQIMSKNYKEIYDKIK